jgi:hypothetical protein
MEVTSFQINEMVICGFSRANSWDSRNQSPKTTPAKKKKSPKTRIQETN